MEKKHFLMNYVNGFELELRSAWTTSVVLNAAVMESRFFSNQITNNRIESSYKQKLFDADFYLLPLNSSSVASEDM